MAYQVRQKDPLLDSTMQTFLAKRSRELIGVALSGVALLLALMLVSYTPDDPNLLAATEVEPQNYLGRFGASLSAILFLVLGYGSWAICIVTATWGARFLSHIGTERALTRALNTPLWIAVVSIYCSTLVPSEGWTHSFGLGGLFGDTVLGALLNIAPVSAAFGLKVVAFMLFFVVLGLGSYALGFNSYELRQGLRFLQGGLGTSFQGVRALGMGAGRGAAKAAAVYRERRDTRATNASEPEYDYDQYDGHGADQQYQSAPLATAPRVDKPSFLSRVPILSGRKAPEHLEPELVTRAPMGLHDIEAPEGDRVKARIASAIQTRVRRGQPITPPSTKVEMPRMEPMMGMRRAEPPITTPAPHATPTAPTPQDLAPFAFQQEEFEVVEPNDDIIPAPTVVASPQPASGPGAILHRKVVQHPPRRALTPSRQAQAEAQPTLKFEEPPLATYEIPPLSLLASPDSVERHHLSDEALEENARMLESVLDDYGVKGEIVSVRPGPVVTMYELEPAPGLKASRVIGLADDIARSMSALSARVSTVPGRSVIGIELPNAHREKVVLREILSARDFGDSSMRLPLALGKDIGGAPIVANLAKMPHLLIAGTTGSGKSVAINTMILSLIYRLSPEECRMIMIDPKMLELSVYDGIPHLLSPVVTDPKKAVVALKWVVGEMEDRYRKMSKMGVRNIEGYNSRVQDTLDKGELFTRTVQTGFDDETGDPVFETEETQPIKLPYIVVIVDEMADLMMVAGKEIEACIQRLAQMARASGIHLIMATQRPSVDVITGTIKANFPTRISFHVTSKIDSRTILGEQGAEQLLGMGDMLYMAGGSRITRVHGPFCSDEEVEEIVTYLKSFGPPEYAASVLDGPDEESSSSIDEVLGLGGNTTGEDALYDQAVAIVAKDRKCSTSYIQRKLGIGYNKAARLVEQMEDNGLVTAANHVGKRDILLPEVE